MLHFADGTLGFKTGENCHNVYSFESLKNKKVKKGVVLFSCYGGKGSEKNNVAYMFSKKVNGKPVLACTGGVSYLKISGKYYARVSPILKNGVHFIRFGILKMEQQRECIMGGLHEKN